MSSKITAGQLFDQLEQQLELAWYRGRSGVARSLSPSDKQSLRPALAGFLNLVHPNNIQILGREEIAYLDSLDARNCWETIAEVVAHKPLALIVSDNLPISDDLAEGAEESGTPLWTSPQSAVELVSHLQHSLSQSLARSRTVHGVFMEVFSIGVLITGVPGSGKSELALELITRGHRLIADDAPLMTRISPDVINGTCPELLQDCLEVRGIGILDIRAMFGDSAIKPNKYLKLIVHLELMDSNSEAAAKIDRLQGQITSQEILSLEIPTTTIPVAPGRNIAVLVEAAVRNHSLKLRGFDAGQRFLQRHQSKLDQDPLDNGGEQK